MKHSTPHGQAAEGASFTVVEDTLWVMGGVDGHSAIQWTQMVRQGQPTQWGPNLTEAGGNHCATTLQDNSVILTGGMTLSNRFSGGARTEIYNSTTKRWERKADMRQRRISHSCTNVWLEPDPSFSIRTGVIAGKLTDRSVLSVVVAGGKMILYFTTHSMSQECIMMRKEGSTLYTVWRCTCPGTTPGWNSLPSLSSTTKEESGWTKPASSHSIRMAF